ncbi:MAG: HAMP domain-containing sensor histidine kinase [Bacteroidota bacterium]
MKHQQKLQTASLLMTLSILLLVVLQAYWLRNAWFDEHRRLKRELGVILRETILQEQMKQWMLSDQDGIRGDSSLIFRRFDRKKDSTLVNDAGNKSNINIVISADSGRMPIPPRFINFDQERNNEDNNETELTVSFPILNGSKNLDSIKLKYARSLADAGIKLAFVMNKMKADTNHIRGEFKIRNNGNVKQERVRKINAELIQARFESPFLVLIQKMKWQVFFAITMIIVTSIAFIFLYRALLQQHRLSDLKNDFIANITHELKTPIATVSVAIEALKSFDAMQDKAKTREYLDISSNELQRLNLLVDKVLKLSMLGQQNMELQLTSIDIKLLINEVLTSMKLQFEKQDAVVNFKMEGDHFIISGDRMHLLSVFYNLLDNALKYSPQQTAIDILLEKLPGMVSVKITDNGIGIADVHQRKIFERFFRVPHGNTHNIKGYGLGLSYVKEVLKNHGASIDVQSQEGKGTKFTVKLPTGEAVST